ncbi:hypothetical protein LTR47_012009 [Exophiala xenobiotica]|nr:hypothetical protein LTR92_011070 [Exophiala xenobiotica]KAK5201734.1 hypothetical protein LTR41_012112 [Exophiala xenobiotica]KAK5215501.1 hypothetical protein LTR47_012009 [Exophiala xenobiotica]KAK5240699.1 hypothetical protein LTS06_012373 [Exophiala xenobiotica]KAK5280980.1 hypothetical protein LTR40_005596 [Exophiala xenobiotica]
MAATQDLHSSEYDYVIVGGGTAGCVIASRLTEYLPNKRILVIEAGDTEIGNKDVELRKQGIELIGGPKDFSYPIVEQLYARPGASRLDLEAQVPARTGLIRLISRPATYPLNESNKPSRKPAFDHISICATVYNLVAKLLLMTSWSVSHSPVSPLLVYSN